MHDLPLVEPPAYYIARTDPTPPRPSMCLPTASRLDDSGDVGVQLISRSWYVADANNHVREVHGEGVVSSRTSATGQTYEYVAAQCWPPPRAPCAAVLIPPPTMAANLKRQYQSSP